MFIRFKAINPGHPGVWRAGRFFPAGELVTLEVITGEDPAEPRGKDGLPSKTQITKAGFEALKKDGRLSFGADEQDGAARDAAVDALRKELAATQAELATAKMRIAELEHAAEGAAKPAKDGGKGKAAEGAAKPAKE